MANNDPELIAWDSCVVLDALQKEEGGGTKGAEGPYRWIKPLVDDAEAGKLVVIVSTLAIAETFFIRDVPPAEQLRIIEEFYDYPWVRPEASGRVIATIARDLRRAHRVDGIDSIHLATAISVSAPVFLTYDGTAKKKKTPLLTLDEKLHIHGETRTLRIRTPEQHQAILHAAANPLFDANAPQPPSAGKGTKAEAK